MKLNRKYVFKNIYKTLVQLEQLEQNRTLPIYILDGLVSGGGGKGLISGTIFSVSNYSSHLNFFDSYWFNSIT